LSSGESLRKDIGCSQLFGVDLDVREFWELRQTGRQALHDPFDLFNRMRLANPLAIEEIVFGQGLPLGSQKGLCAPSQAQHYLFGDSFGESITVKWLRDVDVEVVRRLHPMIWH
jgi:hypothetical protein